MPLRCARGDLGEDVGHVRGRDRLDEQRWDRGDAVLLGPARHRRGEVVKLRGRNDRPRHRALGDEALLLALAGVVRVPFTTIDADDREQYVVTDTGPFLGGEQGPGG